MIWKIQLKYNVDSVEVHVYDKIKKKISWNDSKKFSWSICFAWDRITVFTGVPTMCVANKEEIRRL